MVGKVQGDGWNASLYDKEHSFVSHLGGELVRWLAPKPGEKILDLGCGTGDIANQLSQQGVEITGMDKSENMIEQAQKKYPDLTFIVEDAVNMRYSNEFDAVFSNATLHWIKTPRQALQSIYQALKPGGRFVAEFGGKGNVQTITEAIMNQLGEYGILYKSAQHPWYYPSIGEYTSIMEQVGFRVTHAEHFDRPTPLNGEQGLRNWIEMFATSMFEGVTTETKEVIVTRVEDSLRQGLFMNGEWIADYKRIRVLGIKE
ncbi:methyltransferase domain-containing protein [Neobacillus drentensis]|uniref:class I SAM-dependent methyltransferase n=1 Tax=Neobacillus drentensis TaxID=220684 RepID=UPI002FFEA2F5